jgi:hypothetical protein
VSGKDLGWNGVIGRGNEPFVPSQFPVSFRVWSTGKSGSTKVVPGVPGFLTFPYMRGNIPIYRTNQEQEEQWEQDVKSRDYLRSKTELLRNKSGNRRHSAIFRFTEYFGRT